MKTLLTQYINVDYRAFQSKLFKTHYEFLGVPLPLLKKFYNEKIKSDPNPIFTDSTFEEILLKGYWIIDQKEEINQKIKHIEDYLPLLDNWALCDSFVSYSKWIKNEKEYYKPYLHKYLKSKHEYIIRYALVVFLNYYMEEDYLDELFSIIKDLNRNEYYIQMAEAWLLSYAFILDFEKTFSFIKTLNPNSFIFKKAISKTIESKRINNLQKETLRVYKKSV